jgi:hypothetical protein
MMPRLRRLEIGGGSVSGVDPFTLHLPIGSKGYADAQLDDYRHLPRRGFPWSPPVHMELEARVTPTDSLGTFGFGFWNDPFSLSLGGDGGGRKLPAMPQTLWFFYGSEPNALPLTSSRPSQGWFASSMSSAHLPPLLVAPAAAGAFALSKLPLLRRWVVARTYRMLSVEGAQLPPDYDRWHSYRLDWEPHEARFWVDGDLFLVAPQPTQGPLGFVAWIDNQYAILSHEKGIRFGSLPVTAPQTLELRNIRIS